MNYEEKIAEYRNFLKDRIENARTKHDHYIDRTHYKPLAEAYELEHNLLASDLSKFDEIFGASERSGVGENEEVKEVFDCPVCGTKLPLQVGVHCDCGMKLKSFEIEK